MLVPPFLDLSYYVGDERIEQAIDAVRSVTPLDGAGPVFSAPDLIGIAGDLEQLAIRGGIVELRTEGEAFCGSPNRPNPNAHALGRLIYQRFVGFADLLEPMYGAILVEYSLESPRELKEDSRSLAFKDFYVSRQAIEARAWRDLCDLFGGSVYVREMPCGHYVSMTPCFNPEGKGVRSVDAQRLSVRVAAHLARSLYY